MDCAASFDIAHVGCTYIHVWGVGIYLILMLVISKF